MGFMMSHRAQLCSSLAFQVGIDADDLWVKYFQLDRLGLCTELDTELTISKDTRNMHEINVPQKYSGANVSSTGTRIEI